MTNSFVTGLLSSVKLLSFGCLFASLFLLRESLIFKLTTCKTKPAEKATSIARLVKTSGMSRRFNKMIPRNETAVQQNDVVYSICNFFHNFNPLYKPPLTKCSVMSLILEVDAENSWRLTEWSALNWRASSVDWSLYKRELSSWRLRLLHCTINNSSIACSTLIKTVFCTLWNCIALQLFPTKVLENMSHAPAASEDVISSFKKLLDTDVAVPVAAMNSLVCY